MSIFRGVCRGIALNSTACLMLGSEYDWILGGMIGFMAFVGWEQ